MSSDERCQHRRMEKTEVQIKGREAWQTMRCLDCGFFRTERWDRIIGPRKQQEATEEKKA